MNNNAKTERELEKIFDYIREHIDEFYAMDYSTMASYINVDKLEEIISKQVKKEISLENK